MACDTSCSGDADCIGGDHCVNGSCISGSTCDKDGHTSIDPSNNRKDCSPFLCVNGNCASSCATVSDCVPPNVCDPSGQCVLSSASAPSDSGGCALGGTSKGAGGAAWLFVVAAIAAARRRESLANLGARLVRRRR
jgi:MYXO-CTERM domain-containing protein